MHHRQAATLRTRHVAQLVVHKHRMLGPHAQGLQTGLVSAGVGFEDLGVGGVHDHIKLLEQGQTFAKIRAVKQIQFVGQNAQLVTQRLGLLDGRHRLRPDHSRHIGPPSALHKGLHLGPVFTQQTPNLAGALHPVIAFTDLIGLHGLPQRIGLGRKRALPGQRAGSQAQSGFAQGVGFEQGAADDPTKVQNQGLVFGFHGIRHVRLSGPQRAPPAHGPANRQTPSAPAAQMPHR